MRHTNRKGFEQYLASSATSHRLYAVAASEEQMRKEAVELILAKLPKDAIIERFSGADATLSQILNALESRNLLGIEPVVVVEDLEKKLLEALSSRCKALTFGYLVIASKTKSPIAFVDECGVICDLTEEKPWERDKRLLDSLYDMARAEQRSLESDAAAWMLERIDKFALAQEMEKLLCYTEGKKVIKRADVEQICSQSKTSAVWQVAEELVWEQIFRADAQDLRDSSFFFGLLAAVRQQLTMGAKMHSLLQGSTPFAEWGAHFPKVFPKTLEKRAMACRKLEAGYFRKSLDMLFDLEMLAKSASIATDALTDYLRLKLNYALSSAKSSG